MDYVRKGVNIFNAVNNISSEFEFEKLSCVATDGAPAMKGKNLKLVGELRKMMLILSLFIALFITSFICTNVKFPEKFETVCKSC